VAVGAPVPGTTQRQAYLRRLPGDTVYHAHTNPRLALGDPPRALVDGRLLAGTPGPGQVEVVGVQREAGGTPVLLRRLPGSPPGPWAAQTGSRWQVEAGRAPQDGSAGSVEAYLAFLFSARYHALLAPGQFRPTAVRSRLWWRCADGSADTLEVGERRPEGGVLVRRLGTGHVAAVEEPVARLLLPAAAVLLAPLPDPSPYAAVLGGGRAAGEAGVAGAADASAGP